MTREEKLLKAVDKSARGIEIGPSHSPIASKRDGFRVTTIDTLSKDGLLEKYKDHGVKLENIEDVDFVWSGERYPCLLYTSGYYSQSSPECFFGYLDSNPPTKVRVRWPSGALSENDAPGRATLLTFTAP